MNAERKPKANANENYITAYCFFIFIFESLDFCVLFGNFPVAGWDGTKK